MVGSRESVTGAGLSPAMLAIVKQRSRKLGIDAELFIGDSDALNFLSTGRNRADHLRGSEGGEVPEGTLERSLVIQPPCGCQPAKLLESYLVGIEQDFADHQSTTTLEHAA